MKNVKVIHYIWSANFGGIEKLVIELTRAQLTTGHTSAAILIGCRKGSFMEDLVRLQIPHFYADIKSGFDLRPVLIRKIRKIISEYDIVHIHTFNLLIFIAAVLEKKKIVYTIHGNFNFGRKVTFADRITNLLRTWCLNHHTHLITFNSKFTGKIAAEKYGLSNASTKVIYNGIFIPDAEKIQVPESAELNDKLKGKFIVGTTCRFNGFKRIDRLIEAFATFSARKSDVVLLLVGDGIIRQDLENQVTQLKIAEKTLFTGYQSNVAGFQKLMDVCVFPSENEPFGLVAVETLALGKPTILFSDAGGMLEIIQDHLNEDVVESTAALSDKLEQYYSRKGQTDHEKIKIRKAIAAKFDAPTMEAAFYNSYLSLLSQN